MAWGLPFQEGPAARNVPIPEAEARFGCEVMWETQHHKPTMTGDGLYNP